jgi:ABC-type transport system involved in multi-copper enzyme maturation permease subunit
MLGRVFAIAMNTYREAVRARVLFGLLGAALAVSIYSLFIAATSLGQEMRIVADLGSGSISLFGILVAIVLGATSLYRELELKTVFPILTRQLRRHEYIVGKYLGILSVLLAFVAIDGAAILTLLALQSKEHVVLTFWTAMSLLAVLGFGLWRAKLTRVFIVLPWSVAAFACMALLAHGAGPERQLVIVSALLTMCEVAIITAVATFFSSFSSPFLTAILTFMVFVVGRVTDTAGNLPAKMFGALGPLVHGGGVVVSRVFPNLYVYVPARPVLLGQVPNVTLASYCGSAMANALLYAGVLLALSAIVFRRRDFQ